MKCPSCSALCLPTDPACFACRRPLGSTTGSGSRGKPSQVTSVLALVGCIVGAKLAPEIGRAMLSIEPAEGFDVTAVGLAGIGGGLGALLGGMLGWVITRLMGRRHG